VRVRFPPRVLRSLDNNLIFRVLSKLFYLLLKHFDFGHKFLVIF